MSEAAAAAGRQGGRRGGRVTDRGANRTALTARQLADAHDGPAAGGRWGRGDLGSLLAFAVPPTEDWPGTSRRHCLPGSASGARPAELARHQLASRLPRRRWSCRGGCTPNRSGLRHVREPLVSDEVQAAAVAMCLPPPGRLTERAQALAAAPIFVLRGTCGFGICGQSPRIRHPRPSALHDEKHEPRHTPRRGRPWRSPWRGSSSRIPRRRGGVGLGSPARMATPARRLGSAAACACHRKPSRRLENNSARAC